MADNKKKFALERSRKKVDSFKAEINTNPKSVDGAAPAAADSSSPSGGVDTFTSGLTEAWQSSRANEFSNWIIDDVKKIREEWDKVSGNIEAALQKTPKEDKVPDGSDAADKKWDRILPDK